MDRMIVLLGFGMVLLSNYSNGNLHQLGQMLGDPNSGGNSIISNQRMLLVMGGEIIFVIILASIAGASDEAGGVIIVFLLVIALLWSMKNGPDLTKLFNNLQGK